MSELNFKILGEFPQVLEINLEPQKILIANGATLLFMDEEIVLEIRDTDGAEEVEEEDTEEENEEEEDIDILDYENEEDINNEILEGIEEEPFGEDDEEEDIEEDNKKSILDKFISVVKKKLQKSPKKEAEDSTLEELLGSEEEQLSSEEQVAEEAEELPPAPTLSITHFDNPSEFVRKVAFAPIAGKVLHINLATMEEQEIYIRKESFLCARKGTTIGEGIDTDLKIHRADLENLVFSKIEGNSDIFIQAEQSFIEKKIVETEEEDDASIRVNLGSLLAYETSLRLDLDSIKTVKYLYSEEEIQTILLKGTGTFWLQSSHLQQTFHRLLPYFYEEKQVEVVEETPSEEALADIDDLLAQDVEEEESTTEMEWDMTAEESSEEAEEEGGEEVEESSEETEEEGEIPPDFDPEELEKIKAMADLDDEALKKMLGDD